MALEIKNIVAGYTREVHILNGMNVNAQDGRVTLLIGPNGAGKSTLLKTIYGYLKPESGEILHDGKSLVGLKPKDMLREGIAYLIQGYSVFTRMTVEENLELGGWIMRDDRTRMKEAFERLYARYPRLKEKRRLVLMPRETPLHLGHCEMLVKACQLGAIVAPPMPALYTRPQSVDDIIDQHVGRMLDLFDLDPGLVKRWQGAALPRSV